MDRRTFFDYVTKYWDLAGAEGREAELVSCMLAALRDSEPTIGRRPDDEGKPGSGYLSHLQVAWFRRSELTRLAKTFRATYEKEFVKETGAFVERTTSFVVNGEYETLQGSAFAARWIMFRFAWMGSEGSVAETASKVSEVGGCGVPWFSCWCGPGGSRRVRALMPFLARVMGNKVAWSSAFCPRTQPKPAPTSPNRIRRKPLQTLVLDEHYQCR